MSPDVSAFACDLLASWELRDSPRTRDLNAFWAVLLVGLGLTCALCGPRCGTGVASVSALVIGASVGDLISTSSVLAHDCDMRGLYVVSGALMSLIGVFATRACATLATTTVAAIGAAAFWYGAVPPFQQTSSEFTFYNQPVFPFWTWVLVCMLGCVVLVVLKRAFMRKVVPAIVSGLSVGLGAWHAGVAADHRLSSGACAGIGAAVATVAVVIALHSSLRRCCARKREGSAWPACLCPNRLAVATPFAEAEAQS
jgi:hypothetical protein